MLNGRLNSNEVVEDLSAYELEAEQVSGSYQHDGLVNVAIGDRDYCAEAYRDTAFMEVSDRFEIVDLVLLDVGDNDPLVVLPFSVWADREILMRE